LNEAETRAEHQTTSTWETLLEIGFAEVPGGLIYDLGDLELKAIIGPNRAFQDVVWFSGVMASSRKISHIEFQLPLFVESRDQCLGWLTWELDKYGDSGELLPLRDAEWLHQGRKYRHLLPHERSRIAYEARPKCSAETDWLKLALKTLARYVAEVEDHIAVEVGFDGNTLSFQIGDKSIILVASGEAWPSRYWLPAERLKSLPKRLRRPIEWIGIWNEQLSIGRYQYTGLVEIIQHKTEGLTP